MVKKIVTGIFALIILAGIAGAAGGSDESADTTNNTNNNDNSPQTAENEGGESDLLPGIGDPARDGKFEFTITAFECGATVVGTNEFLQEKAQGQFCIMDLNVKNIGDESQTLFTSDQKILNSEGQQFSNDTSAELAIDGNQDIWLQAINPGNFVQGQVVFDVPTGTNITKAELHDSALSNGIEVDLAQ